MVVISHLFPFHEKLREGRNVLVRGANCDLSFGV